jgi:hypothetical protein
MLCLRRACFERSSHHTIAIHALQLGSYLTATTATLITGDAFLLAIAALTG